MRSLSPQDLQNYRLLKATAAQKFGGKYELDSNILKAGARDRLPKGIETASLMDDLGKMALCLELWCIEKAIYDLSAIAWPDSGCNMNLVRAFYLL